MKHLFPFLLAVLITQSGFAQHVAWAKQWGDENNNFGLSPATDAQGNVYVCGRFQGTLDFDPGPGEVNLTSHGSDDAYICKFGPQGNLIWAKNIGGPGYDDARRIVLSSAGYLYVMGAFEGTVDFDLGPGNMPVTSQAPTYLAKYDPGGNPVWVRQLSHPAFRTNFVVDADENILLSGEFHGTQDFDPGSGTYSMTGTFVLDAFVCKLDPAGQFVWAFQIPHISHYIIPRLDTDFQGNVYIGAVFDTTVDFNPGPGVDTLTATNLQNDGFIAKYAPDGQFVWVRQLRGNSEV